MKLSKYQPSCFLAHELINKLSVIVGYSDLLKERITGDIESLAKVEKIREIAASTAQKFSEHQCAVDAAMKAALDEKELQSPDLRH